MRGKAAAPSIALLLFFASAARAQDIVDGFVARIHVSANGVRMPYRLYIPDQGSRRRALPLVVYLHGSGGVGDDNRRQISGGNVAGTHLFATSAMQIRHPAFVVAPQLPVGQRWGAPDSEMPSPYATLVLELLETLAKEFSIDANRIYLMGQSLGGRGVWDLVSKRPNLFAAGVPLCADGNSARAGAARRVPIWAFHGAADPVVSVAGSRDLVAALKALGSRVKYTEYADVGHDVWTRAFAEPALPDWLFAQSLAKR
jgi:predicted peptidase